MTPRTIIDQFLADHDIAYEPHEHPAVFTTNDVDELAASLPGERTKNLFLRNKKGNQQYLFTVHADSITDTQALREFLGSTKLSFGSAERLQAAVNTYPGAVSPLGLVFDQPATLIVGIQESLLQADYMTFHPNDNTLSYAMSPDDLMRFYAATGHEPLLLPESVFTHSAQQ